MLPAASVAEQLTVVTPNGNVEPEAGLQVTRGVSGFWSVAGAVKVTTAPDEPMASWVILLGRLSVGGVVSWLTTVICLQEVEFAVDQLLPARLSLGCCAL
jgi:hypothetical protein